jgi:hypothetical protein
MTFTYVSDYTDDEAQRIARDCAARGCTCSLKQIELIGCDCPTGPFPIATDPSTWSECAQSDLSVYSDLHKDVYGFRPRGHVFASEAEFTAEFARLVVQLGEVIDEEHAAKVRAAKALKARLRGIIADHGVDAVTALRWDFDALGLRGWGDWGQYAFETGVSYKLDRFLERKNIKFPT